MSATPGSLVAAQAGGGGVTNAAPWVRKPERASGDPPLFLREVVADAPPGARVLDAGCGPGSWPYRMRPDLRIVSFDVKYPPGPPARAPNVAVFRADVTALLAGTKTIDHPRLGTLRLCGTRRCRVVDAHDDRDAISLGDALAETSRARHCF